MNGALAKVFLFRWMTWKRSCWMLSNRLNELIKNCFLFFFLPFTEPHPLDRREKFDRARGGRHRRSGSGETGKCRSQSASSAKRARVTVKTEKRRAAWPVHMRVSPVSGHLGTLCSVDPTGFRREFETGAEYWRGEIRERGGSHEQMAPSS